MTSQNWNRFTEFVILERAESGSSTTSTDWDYCKNKDMDQQAIIPAPHHGHSSIAESESGALSEWITTEISIKLQSTRGSREKNIKIIYQKAMHWDCIISEGVEILLKHTLLDWIVITNSTDKMGTHSTMWIKAPFTAENETGYSRNRIQHPLNRSDSIIAHKVAKENRPISRESLLKNVYHSHPGLCRE